jgi:hypothetical protein
MTGGEEGMDDCDTQHCMVRHTWALGGLPALLYKLLHFTEFHFPSPQVEVTWPYYSFCVLYHLPSGQEPRTQT